MSVDRNLAKSVNGVTYQEFVDWWRVQQPARQAGFLVWPSLSGPSLNAKEAELIERFAPWGISLFGRNLKDYVQAEQLTQAIRVAWRATRPQGWPTGLIAIDEEGGRVSRLPPPFPKLPAPFELAKHGAAAIASQARFQAETARNLGINMIFAPVCDVLVEPANKVIGDRAFGTDAKTVYESARIAFQEISSAGIVPVIKHFPGHGATVDDTHQQSARATAPLEVLRSRELAVFRWFIEQNDLPAIMTCHVSLEAVDPNVPATLSKKVIDGLLRHEMGFTGVVMSDDLRMNAISSFFSVTKEQEVAAASDQLSKLDASHRAADAETRKNDAYLIQAARTALQAGCDVVLACRGIEREEVILSGIEQALQSDSEFAAACAPKAFRVFKLVSAAG
jgi:beta-N-acetylhexosaminidase